MNEKEGEEVEQVEDAENEEGKEKEEAKPGPIASRLIERKATKRKREPTGRTIAKRNARIRNK
jgi:hypothetical protein